MRLLVEAKELFFLFLRVYKNLQMEYKIHKICLEFLLSARMPCFLFGIRPHWWNWWLLLAEKSGNQFIFIMGNMPALRVLKLVWSISIIIYVDMSEAFEFIPQLIILHPFFLLLQTFCILYLALRGYIFAYNPHLCA